MDAATEPSQPKPKGKKLILSTNAESHTGEGISPVLLTLSALSASGKSQISVYPRAQIVPVQPVNVLSVNLDQFILQRRGYRGLFRSGAARHPQCRPLLFQRRVPRFGG